MLTKEMIKNQTRWFGVYSFMTGDGLMLSGVSLLVYACIFDSWINGEPFCLSCEGLSSIIGSNRFTVNRAVISLQEKGLIIRDGNKSRFGAFSYSINESILYDTIKEWNKVKAEVKLINLFKITFSRQC